MTQPILLVIRCLALAVAIGGGARAGAQHPAAAQAQPAPAVADAARSADPARGKRLAYTCQGCHGIAGYKNAYPNFHVPLIGGQSQRYLQQALGEYRRGTRKHPTMQAQAQSFSDQDIADVAAYLSSLKP